MKLEIIKKKVFKPSFIYVIITIDNREEGVCDEMQTL